MKELFIIKQLRNIRKDFVKLNKKLDKNNTENILIEYLEKNCKGYNNREKAYKLMKIIEITDHKTFRTIIERIRQDKKKTFICSEAGKNGGYWIPTTIEEMDKTIDHIEARGYEMFKTAKILREKKERSEKNEKL